MELENWKTEFENWLGGFAWVWFCTLTFRPGFNERQARWRLHRWLEELRAALGTPDFGYFSVREWGKTGADLHFHVLLMGIKAWHAQERVEFMRRWRKLGGDALIDVFKPGIGGPGYILKDAKPSDPDAIDFELPSNGHIQREWSK